MPPGVAAVVVQVLTGDAEAKMKHLGDTVTGQAKAMETAFAKSGAVMSTSMGSTADAIDVALLSSKEYAASLAHLEGVQKAYAEAATKGAAEIKAAEDSLIAKIGEQKAARESLARASTVQQAVMVKNAIAAADAEVAAAERRIGAAKRVAAAQETKFTGEAIPMAQRKVVETKASATRDVEGQLAAQKKLEQAAGKQAAAMQSLQRFGGKALLGIGAAATVAGVEAVKMGIGFENAQKKFEAFSGQGEQAGKALTQTFEGTAGRFRQSGQDLESAYAGVSRQVQMTQGHVVGAAGSLQFMTAASDLTTASGEKLQNVTKDLASVMQVYKVKLGDAADTSNKLFNASRTVSTSVDSMTSLVTKLHARLGDIGGGLSSVLGLMTEASSFGLTGGRGVLIFNQALERLTSDSKRTTDVLGQLGVHLHNSKNEFVGLPSVVDQLHHAYQRLTPAQREFATQQLFGKGATGEFTEIIRNGRSGLERFTDATHKQGEVQRAAKKQNESFTGQLEVMWAAVHTAGGALGKSLIPELKDLVGGLKSGAEWLTHNSGAALALAGVLITGLGAAMGAFVGGKVAAMVAGLKAVGVAFGILTGDAVAAEAGVVGAAEGTAAGVDAALLGTGLGAILVAASFGVLALKDHWVEAGQGIEEAAQGMANYVIKALNEMIDGVNEFIAVVTLGLAPAIGKIGELSGAGEGGGKSKLEQETARSGTSEAQLKKMGLGGLGNAGNKFDESNKEGGIMAFFMKHAGLNAAQAAGVVGNFQQESTLNFGLNERAPEGGTNIGVASWHDAGRQKALKKFAGEHGLKWTNPEAQLAFALKEMSEKGVLSKLKKAKSPAEAAEIVNQFEGGTDPEHKREHYAEHAFKAHPQALFGEENGPGNEGLQRLLEENQHGKPKETAAQKEAKALQKSGINPFAYAHNLQQTREDMGIDYSMKVGDKIIAPGAGVIDKIISNWYKGQPLIEEKITSGKNKGMYFYVAEQIKAAVHQGEHVKAGATLGTFAATGTGVEAGLGAGEGTTLAQSRHEFVDHPGNAPTRATGEFKRFLSGLNKGGSLEQGGANTAFEKATKAFEAIEKTGKTMFRKYEDAIQNGTVRSLDKLTGVTAKDPTGAHSVQFAEFSLLLGNLRASGLTELANKLVIVHREAMSTLAKQIIANAQEKEAAVIGERLKHMQNELSLANLVSDKTLEIRKDEAEKVNQAIQAAAHALGDTASVLRSEADKAFTALQDAAQEMTDQFSGRSTAVKDETAVAVDRLNERGKYGLDLQAQREQVALDQLKQQYDAQLAQMRLTLDQTKTLEDSLVAQKSLSVTQVTARENAKVAAAQAVVNGDRLHVDQVLLGIQTKIGTTQTHVDDKTSKDLLKQVVLTLKGGSKTDLAALAAKTHEDEKTGEAAVAGLNTELGQAEREGKSFLQRGEEGLSAAQAAAEAAVAAAAAQLSEAEATAKKVIQEGETGLRKTEGEAEVKESEAQGKIDEIKAKASTQYAGSGLVVNFTNIPSDDAAAIQSELGFLMRTKLGV